MFEDSRGRARKLTITHAFRGEALVCEADRKALVGTGTLFEWRSKGLKLTKSNPEKTSDTVGPLPGAPGKIPIATGDRVRFIPGTAAGFPASPEQNILATVSIDLPAVFRDIRVSHRVFMDDGKFGGAVASLEGPEGDCSAFEVEITDVVGGAAKLLGEKGINLPDTVLRMPALGAEDLAALRAILPLKPDLVALSFVQTPEDILELHEILARARDAYLAVSVGVL